MQLRPYSFAAKAGDKIARAGRSGSQNLPDLFQALVALNVALVIVVFLK
jgi:uncharacterized membrane-anchored protein